MTEFLHGNDKTASTKIYRDGRQAIIVSGTVYGNEFPSFLTWWDLGDDKGVCVFSRKKALEIWASKKDVLEVMQPSAGPYLQAKIGDVLKTENGDWSHIVTEEDLKQGFAVHHTYRGTVSGLLIVPIFLRPRTVAKLGSADRPSVSAF